MKSVSSGSSPSHGEEQEAAEGAVVVAVVPQLRVVPQLHPQRVAALQQQGGAVGRRVAALARARRLLVGDELHRVLVPVEHGAHVEVGGGIGREADVVDAADRRREHTWRGRRVKGSFVIPDARDKNIVNNTSYTLDVRERTNMVKGSYKSW